MRHVKEKSASRKVEMRSYTYHTHIHTHTHMHTHSHTHTLTHTHSHTHILMRHVKGKLGSREVEMSLYTYIAQTHTHVCTHMLTHTHTHVINKACEREVGLKKSRNEINMYIFMHLNISFQVVYLEGVLRQACEIFTIQSKHPNSKSPTTNSLHKLDDATNGLSMEVVPPHTHTHTHRHTYCNTLQHTATHPFVARTR